jgi:hypothetical protein
MVGGGGDDERDFGCTKDCFIETPIITFEEFDQRKQHEGTIAQIQELR